MGQKSKLALAAIFAVLFLANAAVGQEQELPNGKGKTEFIDNCLDCHRADMVIRVKKTPDEWKKNVAEMASRGSQGTKQDLDNVVLYLDTYFSTNSAPAASSQSPDINRAKQVIADNSCLTCHRIEQQGAYAAPTLNGIATRRTPDQIRAAIVGHPNPSPAHERKIAAEDLDDLVRYLSLLPPLPESVTK